MTDEMTELKRRLDEIERKTAIWRSQVVVFLLVFVVGWIASALWMKARLEARAEKTERAFAEKRKTVEAENFVVRDASGKKWASFGMNGTRKDQEGASVGFYDEKNAELTRIVAQEIMMFTPDKNPAVLLMGDEALSGIFLIGRDESESAFAAWVEKSGGYAVHSKKPMGGQTVSFAEVKAGTVAP